VQDGKRIFNQENTKTLKKKVHHRAHREGTEKAQRRDFLGFKIKEKDVRELD